MSKSNIRAYISLSALSLATAFAAPAFAQDKPADAAQAADQATAQAGDPLGQIVVTASAGNRSSLNTSTSITSVTSEQIQNFNPTSSAELYRLIPGVQVGGTQGEGGNSNIGIRGLRTPTGGSPFVQVQEDSLPVVLFGDIQFGNNDYWTHSSPTDERLEAIRGGTASTLASQAIGLVLNHISFTGRNDGGYAELQKGINYDYTRANFRVGSSINDSTYFNLGGYYNVGHGILHAAYNVSNSYSIKGNITKEFDEGKGFVRLLFKASDTQEPSYNGCISSGSLSGTSVGKIGPSAICDARNQASGYSALNSGALFSDVSGNLARQPLDGIRTNEKWVQLQTHYEFGNGLTVDDNARVARMKGAFDVQFYGAGLASGAVGAGQSIIYANGPNAGKVFTGQFVSSSASVHTNMNHMDHVANDLKLDYKAETGGVKVDFKLGYQYYSQRIAEDWHANNSLVEATGNTPAQLDLVSGLNGTGALLAAGGQSGFNMGWNQQFDITFTDHAPYADLNLDIGNLNLDASIREEIFQASGFAQGSSGKAIGPATSASNPACVAGGCTAVVQTDPRTGATVTTFIPLLGYDGPVNAVNFSEHATNYSLGALYKITPDLSVFARGSHGVRFNADRTTNNGYFAPDGSLNAAGLANAAFPVTQYEVGLKSRGALAGGRYSVELVGFYSKYTISSAEINAVVCTQLLGKPATTCTVAGGYRDTGVELTTTYRNSGFNLFLTATYDHSRVRANQAAPFLKSPNIPSLTYSGLLSYDVADRADIGLSVTGQTSTLGGDGNTYRGSAVFGLFAHVEPVKHVSLGLDIYNLFNTFASQGPAGFIGGTGNTLLNVNPAQGRGVKGSVKFSF